jgi:hypothetical protein
LWTRDALELVVEVASFVVSLQYSVDELLKGFICTFEERWEAKEQDSDEHGQRRHAFAFPIWKFFHSDFWDLSDTYLTDRKALSRQHMHQ